MGKLRSKIAFSFYAIFTFILGLLCIGGGGTFTIPSETKVAIEAANTDGDQIADDGGTSTTSESSALFADARATSYPITNVPSNYVPTLPYGAWSNAFNFYEGGGIDTLKPGIEVVYIPNTAGYFPVHAFRYHTSIKYIYIQSRTTTLSIPNNAFEKCTALQYVQWENTKDTIVGASTFKGCTSLKYVDCTGVTMFQDRAFQSCNNLLNIGNPAKLQESTDGLGRLMPGVGVSAFEGCSSLTFSVDITGLTTIPEKAFKGCQKLQSVGYTAASPRSSLDTIGKQAFQSCNQLNYIDISYVRDFGDSVFQDCRNLRCTDAVGDTVLIKTLGRSSFYGAHNLLQQVSLQMEDINKVFYNSFKDCTSLTRVEGMVEYLDAGAFDGCINLEYVQVSVSNIPDRAFRKCAKLTTINNLSPNSIGSSAFMGCTKLTNINLSYLNQPAIYYETFRDCINLTSISALSSTIKGIQFDAFRACVKLNAINLDNVTEIGQSAFEGCSSLNRVEGASKVTTIGMRAFRDCVKLRTINLPSIVSIGAEAFRNCHLLSDVYNTVQLKTLGARSFKGCDALVNINLSKVVQVPEEAFNGCTILRVVDLSSATHIGRKAFYQCTGLMSVGNTSNLIDIYSEAFAFCSSLQSINLENCQHLGGDIEVDGTREGRVFAECTSLSDLGDTRSIEEVYKSTFKGCTSLKTIDLSGVTFLGDHPFEGSGLREVNLSSLTSLYGQEAYGGTTGTFLGATNLQKVILGSSLKEIPAYCFLDCLQLNEINLENVEIIGSHAFTETKLTEIDLRNVVELHQGAFYLCGNLTSVGQLPKLTLLEGGTDGVFEECSRLNFSNILSNSHNLKIIGERAFNNCTYSTIVYLPTSVHTIKSEAFSYTNFTRLLFSSSTTYPQSQLRVIETCAFESSRLTDFGFSNAVNLEYIGDNAFYECLLWSVTLPASVTTLGDGAFSFCYELSHVDMSQTSLTDIADCCFQECYDLSLVDFPTNLKTIGEYAFTYTHLTNIQLPSSVTLVKSGAFSESPITSFTISSPNISLQSHVIGGDVAEKTQVELAPSVLSITDTTDSWGNQVSTVIVRGSHANGERSAILSSCNLFASAQKSYVPKADWEEYIAQSTFKILSDNGSLRYYPIIISYDSNGGTAVSPTSINDPWTGVHADLAPANPTREGHTFLNWYHSNTDRRPFTYAGTDFSTREYAQDRTVIAGWERLENTIDWATVFNFEIVEGRGAVITGFKEEYKSIINLKLPDVVKDNDNPSTTYPVFAINPNAFSIEHAQLMSVDLSNATHLRSIGERAFYNQSALTQVNLGTSVQELGHEVFAGAQFSSITIPASLTSGLVSAIHNSNLSSIIVDENNPVAASIDNKFLTNKEKNVLIYMVPVMDSYVRVPDGITGITITEGEGHSNHVRVLDLNNVTTVNRLAPGFRGLTQLIVGTQFNKFDNMQWYDSEDLKVVTIQGKVGVDRTAIPTLATSVFHPNAHPTIYVPLADLDLYKADAQWSNYNLLGYGEETGAKIYVITVDNNGGTGVETVTVVKGDNAILPLAPTREGYTLVGWKTIVLEEETLATPTDFAWGSPVDHNMTVQAQWQAIDYTYHLELNEGTLGGETGQVNINYTIGDFGDDKAQVISLSNPTRTGYEFLGWYSSETFESAVVTAIRYEDYRIAQITGQDITLYARWQRITFAMTVPDLEDDGFKIAYPEGYGNPTPYGETFRFMVVFEEGYTQNSSANIVVTAVKNGVETSILTVKVENGVEFYEIPNVLSTYTIRIDGVVLNKYNVYFRPGILSDTLSNMPSTIQVTHGSSVADTLNDVSLDSPTADGYKFVSWNLVRIVDGKDDISNLPYNFNSFIYEDTIITATWTLNSYTITLKLNGGEVAGGATSDIKVSYTIEDTVVLPTYNTYGLSRKGYAFLGWKQVIDDVEQGDNSDPENPKEYFESIPRGTIGNKTFRANWEIITYSISYNLNNGTLEGKYPTTFTVKDEVILPTATRIGHTFLGWSKDRTSANSIINIIEEGTTENYVLYANWRVNSYQIVYHLNGDEVAPVSVNNVTYNNNLFETSYEYSDDALYTLLSSSDLKREGFTFGGWYDNPEFTGDKYTTIQATTVGDKEYYAKWNASEYTFILVGNGGQINDMESMTFTFTYQNLVDENGRILLAEATREGYHFIGWYDNTGKLWDAIRPAYLEGVAQDKPFTLVARWSNVEYKLTVTGDNIDKIKLVGERNDITTSYGGTLKFLIHYNDPNYNKSQVTVRYTMGGVTNEVITADEYGYYIIPEIVADVTISIEGIELNSYTIAFHCMFEDVSIPGITGIAYGTTATRPSDPQKAGYNFIGWYTDPEYLNLYDWDSPIVDDITLYAKWDAEKYVVTIKNNVNDSTITTSYDISTIKTFNAPSSINGYDFVGYYIDATIVDGSYDFTHATKVTDTQGFMGDVTIIAKYNLVTYEIHYAAFGGTHSNVSNYNITSADITLTPASKTGYDFIGWVKAGTEEIVTVIPQGSYGDIYLEAKFDLISGQFYGVRYYWEDKYLGELAVRKDNPVLGDSLLADIEEEGYTFEGWYASADFTGDRYTTDSTISADITLYAKMTPVEYRITYHSPVTVELPSKVTYTILDTFVVENVNVNGYAFLGWYTGVVESGDNWNWDNATKVDQITKQTGDIDLYVRFSPYTYTITYMLEGGVATNPETYTVESNSFALQDATKEGYTFIGWYNGNEKVTSIERGSYGNITLTARYTVDTYTISYTNNLDKELAENNPTTYTIEDTFMLTHEEVAGYRFDGWYNGEEKVEIITGRIGNLTLVARYTIETYTISYYTSNGTHTNPSTYTIESGEIVLTPATKENYTFLHWTNFEGEEITSIKGGSTGDLTLIAVYELVVENRYEVNFYDGEVVVYQESVIAGQKLTNYPSIEKVGYTFVGYYVDKDFTQEFDTDQDITSNKTVYLRYDLETYHITYVSDTLGFTHTNKTTYSVVDQVTFGKPNTLNGYTFVGWTLENNPITSTKDLTGDITVKAVFALNEYKITYVLNGGVATNPTRYTVEDRDITLTPATKAGYIFVHYEDENGVVYTSIRTNMARDLVLVAVYELDAVEYTEVTYYALGKVYKTEIVEKGHRLTNYSPDDQTGYLFAGWYEDSELTTAWDFDTQTTEDRITLYAKYEEIHYTITYLGVEDTTLPTTYTVNNLVVFPENVEKQGYRFEGWYNGTNKLYSTFGYAENLVIEARFSIVRYTITYERNGGTHENPSTYTILDEITLKEASKAGYTFTGWEDEAGNKVTKIAEGTTGTIKLIATYTINTYTITYTYTGITNVEITNNNPSQATYEDRITLNNPSVKGYKFIGWYQNNQRVTNLEHILTDISLEGRWEKEKYTITLLPEGSQPENIEYTITDEITLPEQSKKGYEFKGWRDVVTGEIYTTISGSEARNITLIPTWEVIEDKNESNVTIVVITAAVVLALIALLYGGAKLTMRVKQRKRRQQKAKDLIESLDRLKENNRAQSEEQNSNTTQSNGIDQSTDGQVGEDDSNNDDSNNPYSY